jgi:hypothetical protein
MGLLLLFEATGNPIMWLTLLVAVGLTYWEVREHRFSTKAQMWWVLLVLLFHVPGYLVLRLTTAFLRNRPHSE